MSLEPISTPAAEAVKGCRLTSYTGWLAEREVSGSTGMPTSEPGRWPISPFSGPPIWEYFDVRASWPCDAVLPDRTMPGASWFPGAELSYAEHVFAGKDGDATALVHASEVPSSESTHPELGRGGPNS
jgi:acetoacetyl-CoA synthetase